MSVRLWTPPVKQTELFQISDAYVRSRQYVCKPGLSELGRRIDQDTSDPVIKGKFIVRGLFGLPHTFLSR